MANLARVAASAGRAAPGASADVQYYGFDYSPLPGREGAAIAITTVRDARGRVLERRFESFKGRPTKSTDPKTGEHGH